MLFALIDYCISRLFARKKKYQQTHTYTTPKQIINTTILPSNMIGMELHITNQFCQSFMFLNSLVIFSQKKIYFGDIFIVVFLHNFIHYCPKTNKLLATWPSILLRSLVLVIFTLKNACLALAIETWRVMSKRSSLSIKFNFWWWPCRSTKWWWQRRYAKRDVSAANTRIMLI